MIHLLPVAAVEHLTAHGADDDVFLRVIGTDPATELPYGWLIAAGIVDAAQDGGDLAEPLFSRRNPMPFHSR